MKLTIGHLYPDLLNLYGDRGNIQCLMRRCQWCGIEAETIAFELDDKIDFSVEQVKEQVDVFVGQDGKTRQVNRGVGKVSASGSNFPGRVVNICGNAGAAAHIGDFCIIVAFFIVLQIKRRRNATDGAGL